MRWALRKQEQIEEKLGKQFLQELKNDLDIYFKTHKTEDGYSQIPTIINGNSYLIQEIPSPSQSNKVHQFVLIKRMYDVFQLSYYKTIDKDNVLMP